MQQVRSVYDDLFVAAEQPDSFAWLLAADPDGERVIALLSSFSVDQPTAFHRTLVRLGMGDRLTTVAHQHFERFLSILLPSISSAADPDQALLRFAGLVDAYGAPRPLYALLESNPNFADLLITICDSSRFLTELVQRDPSLLDGLFTPYADAGALKVQAARGDLVALSRFRNQTLVKIGTDDLFGLTTAEETFMRLADLAEKVFRHVQAEAFRQLVKRRGKPRDGHGRDARFVCFAGGNFGGRELVFGSDLDLFFVYDGEGMTGRSKMDNAQFFTEMAQDIIRFLRERDLYGVDLACDLKDAAHPWSSRCWPTADI